MSKPADPRAALGELTRPELLILFVLACMNFCHILDFMIMMPLGPRFMREFGIDARSFGFLVSAYTFSAAIAGLLGAFVIDKFDRKRALVSVFAGFTLGTLGCALAPTYEILLAARVLAGAFGGIVGALVFAIIGDAIPVERRGRATGIVMGSFSLASIAGVPLGLFLAERFEWHAPFFFIVGLSLLALAIALRALPRLTGHLDTRNGATPWQSIRKVVAERRHLYAFVLVSCMMIGGFSVIPFLSTYLVANAGVPESSLSYVYLFGGMATLVSSPTFGRLADKFGNQRIFVTLVCISLAPILVVTHLPLVPLWLALSVSTAFMVFTSGRMVVAINMVNAAVLPAFRGSFMSINSAVQQMSSGLAAFIASLIVTQAPGEPMEGYGTVGILAAAFSFATVFFAPRLKRENSSHP
jgi:predicted MFS family arabinose efflux permease